MKDDMIIWSHNYLSKIPGPSQFKKKIFWWQYHGVHWCKTTNKWRTQIRMPGGKVSLFSFDDEIAAGKKYDELVKRAIIRNMAWVCNKCSSCLNTKYLHWLLICACILAHLQCKIWSPPFSLISFVYNAIFFFFASTFLSPSFHFGYSTGVLFLNVSIVLFLVWHAPCVAAGACASFEK